jgi:hypothetical protein
MPMNCILSVDSYGIVTVSSDDPDDTFKGFLSADKKTIVGTNTDAESYNLMIIQITEPTFTPGLVPAGTYSSHFLDVGGNSTPLWVHSLFTVLNSGISSYSDWVSSNTSITAPTWDYYINIISPSGTVRSSLNDSYHGQMSSDGMFTVGTQTNFLFNDGDPILFYSLNIDMRTNGVVTP